VKEKTMSYGGNIIQGGSTIPVTVQGSYEYLPVMAFIGDQYYSPQNLPPNQPVNGVWYLIVDLTNLSNVVVNEFTTDTTNVPGNVQKYAGNSQYMLIFATVQLLSGSVPTGAVVQLLRNSGAGTQLARMEQMVEQIGSGSFVYVSYTLAGQMGTGTGFELFSYLDFTILTFQLLPVTVGGKTTYTPIELGP
jgi:hypothetical protein